MKTPDLQEPPIVVTPLPATPEKSMEVTEEAPEDDFYVVLPKSKKKKKDKKKKGPPPPTEVLMPPAPETPTPALAAFAALSSIVESPAQRLASKKKAAKLVKQAAEDWARAQKDVEASGQPNNKTSFPEEPDETPPTGFMARLPAKVLKSITGSATGARTPTPEYWP